MQVRFDAPEQLLVLGPPGTGKTHTLLDYYEKELDRGVHPAQIAYVSFTRKAANEARQRARNKFPAIPDEELRNIATLHSISFAALGLTSGRVMTGRDIREVSQLAGFGNSGAKVYADTGMIVGTGTNAAAQDAFRVVQLAKARGIPIDAAYRNLQTFQERMKVQLAKVVRLRDQLEHYKSVEGKFDYHDMLTEAAHLGPLPGIKTAIIDEAQDLSTAQWQAAMSLFSGVDRIIIAGDDDQAIFQWGGADVDSFHTIDMPRKVLSRSYRLGEQHVALANIISSRISDRFEKDWHGSDHDADIRYVNDFSEVAERIKSGGEWMILGRTHRKLPPVKARLRKWGLVYRDPDGNRSVADDELATIRAWENLRAGREIPIEAARLLYANGILATKDTVRRGGKKSLSDETKLRAVNYEIMRDSFGLLCDPEKKWFEVFNTRKFNPEHREYIRRARRHDEDLEADPRITVSTIHSTKGGEADNVVLLTESSALPMRTLGKRPDEEHRVWYVGATRARKRLFVVGTKSLHKYPMPRRIM